MYNNGPVHTLIEKKLEHNILSCTLLAFSFQYTRIVLLTFILNYFNNVVFKYIYDYTIITYINILYLQVPWRHYNRIRKILILIYAIY